MHTLALLGRRGAWRRTWGRPARIAVVGMAMAMGCAPAATNGSDGLRDDLEAGASSRGGGPETGTSASAGEAGSGGGGARSGSSGGVGSGSGSPGGSSSGGSGGSVAPPGDGSVGGSSGMSPSSGPDAAPRVADASRGEAASPAQDGASNPTAPASDAAGPSSPVTPSAGCGKGGRPAGGEVTVANDHIYDFPASYDGSQPMPLVIALHANANPNTQLQGLTNGTRLATEFVRAFPKSAAAGWVLATDAPRLTTIYADLLANYCIDTSRVFLTGHSSGAQMVVQMLCVAGGEKRFKAVAPVAASKYCASIAPIPVMYIQGMKDAMRNNSNGIDVVDFFTASNACGTTTAADSQVPTCNSALDGKLVTPGCVTYAGCSEPTIWCSHDDNSYNTTDGNMHGWPCFASNAIADFFTGLP